MVQFQFGDDQALVVAVEDIHFPGVALVGNQVAGFVDDAFAAQFVEHGAGVPWRDRVFEFAAAGAVGFPLDGEPGAAALEPHPHRGPFVVAEIALGQTLAVEAIEKGAVADQEFAFDFDAHGLSPYAVLSHQS